MLFLQNDEENELFFDQIKTLQIGENNGVGGLFRKWIIWYVWILRGNTMLFIMSIFFTSVE